MLGVGIYMADSMTTHTACSNPEDADSYMLHI